MSKQNREDTEHRWKRPDPKFVKVNVDAAFYQDAGAGATAAIIRDEKGQFLAAQCKYNDCASDATAMEARAMRDGLQFANSLGFNRVEAESDSLKSFSSAQDKHNGGMHRQQSLRSVWILLRQLGESPSSIVFVRRIPHLMS